MAIYVQLADKLLKVSGDVTAENITQALGYVPFNGEFSELKNSPFTEDESGEYNVVDEAGNIILKINQEGVKTTRVILPKGDVQSQIDGLDGRYSDITLELENLGTEIENIDFESLKNNPITITDGEFIIMDDNEPANIRLKLNTEGLFVRDVYIDGNSIKGQFEDINGQLVDIKQDISDLNTEVENIDFENLKNNPIEITEGEFVIMDDREPSNIGLKLNSEGLFVKDVIIDGESVQTQINELAAQDVTIKGNIENITSEMDSMKTSFTTDNLTVNQKTIINGETTINGTTSVYGTTNVENLITDSIETDGTDLSFTDQSGNTVARIDNTGISAFEVSVVADNEVAHRLSEKANQAYVESEVAEIEKTIADNEKVTSEALTSLDSRMDAAESGITSLNNTKADKSEVNTQISGVTQSLENHAATKATSGVSGHVTLDSGDFKSITAVTEGVAASPAHTHSQYSETGHTHGTITLSGDVSGSAKIGSGETAVNIEVTVADDSHEHHDYLLNTTDTLEGDLTVTGTVEMGDLTLRKDEYVFADASGNTVATIDANGVSSTEFTSGAHKLTEKANQSDVDAQISGVTSTLESEVAEIEKTIADNEKATSEALTSLDSRMDAAESGITSLNSTKADKNEVNTQISGVTQNLENHVATKATGVVSGHVTLDSGDSSTNAYVDGVAAASKHSHSQYVENTGDTITGNLTVTGTVEMGDLTLRKDEFIFTDEDGNKIAEINADGVSSTEFTSGAHKLTAKANQSDLESHAATKATSGVSGHVTLDSGDFKSITAVTEGVAASPAHTHSQYSETGHTHGTITLSGDVSGSAKIGSGETAVDIEVTVADDSHEHHDYLLNTTDTLEGDLTVTGTVEMGDLTLNKDEFIFADGENIIARINDKGVSSTEFTAALSGTTHTLTSKANQQYVENEIAAVYSEIETNEKTITVSLNELKGRVDTAEEDIDNLEKTKADITYADGKISGVTQSLDNHVATKATTATTAHVKLKSGDFKTITKVEDGVAASPYHTHSQYLEKTGGTVTGDLTVTGTVEMGDMVLNKDEFVFADESGYTITRIDKDGVSSTEFTAIKEGGTHKLTEKADKEWVESHVLDQFKVNDAMMFKGTITTEASFPKTFQAGWTYKVATAGTYYGQKLEVGDLVIAVKDVTASTTTTESNFSTYWTAVQTNTDGHVTGPTSATASNIAIFDGTTGKLIEDGGKKITDLAAVSHKHGTITLSGDVTGSATIGSGETAVNITATVQDDSHNHSNYVKKSGDTITGNLTVTGIVEMGDLTLEKEEFVFTDASGNKIATIDANGVSSTEFTAVDENSVEHKLTEKVETSGATTVDNVVVYADTDGKKVKDSGFTIKTSVPENAVFTDSATTVDGHYSPTATTNSTSDKIPITHSIKKGEPTPDLIIPSLKYDSKGHITSVSTTKYEFPEPLAYSSDITNIQTIITDNEEVVAAALADIDDKKLNASGGTITGNLVVTGTVEMGDMVLNQSEYEFADESGNVIAKINSDGFVDAVDFVTKEGKKLSECITSAEIAELGGGDVIGPSSATAGNVVTFDGTTGKLIKDSGYTIAKSVPHSAVFTDTTYSLVSASGGTNTANTTDSTNGVRLNLVESGTNIVSGVKNSIQFIGSNNVTVESTTAGTISIKGPTLTGYAPNYHATTSTTYGVSDTYNYAHVKLTSGDCSDVNVLTAGLAVSPFHYHSQYLPTSGGTMTGDITVDGSDRKLSNCIYDSNTGDTAGNVGSGVKPVYINDYKVIACSYELNKTVPSNALFTDEKVKATGTLISTATTTYYLLGHSSSATTTATAYKSSGVYVTEGSKVCAANGFFQTSDANLKNFHGDIPLDFERLKKIPKVYYSWKDDEKQTKHIGTSAQEVQKVYPELVSIGVNNELSVDYPKFTMVALKAVDVLYEENQTLKQELEQMKTDMAAIKMKLGL